MEILCLLTAIQALVNPPVILRATIHEQCVFSPGVKDGAANIKWTSGGGQLWIQKKIIKDDSPVISLDYMSGINGRKDALLRWQLIDGKYSCVSYAWGGGDLASSFRRGVLSTVPLAAIELVNAIRKDAYFYQGQYEWKYNKLIEPALSLGPVSKAIGWGGDLPTVRRIFFDFWCRGGQQYEVYVTEPHKGNRLTRGDYHPEWVRQHDHEKWEQVGEWTFDWTGPFYVAARGNERFFVSEAGRVYTPPRGGKPLAPLKELWQGPPVDALIHDDDKKTWYGFTKDQYFEIADPIVPKPHAIAVKRARTADEAVITAAKCGRVIRGLDEPEKK